MVDVGAQIKRRTLEEFDDLLAELPENFRTLIAESVTESFESLETTVTKELTVIIDEKKRQIEQADEQNQREAEGRDRAITALTSAAKTVAKNRQMLQQVLTLARQAR
jgi:hypothetical protein